MQASIRTTTMATEPTFSNSESTTMESDISIGLRTHPTLQNHTITTTVGSPMESPSKQIKLKGTRQPRSSWDGKEDEKLISIINSQLYGNVFKGKWPAVAAELGNGRSSKQCRDRWLNYLRPGIKKGQWTQDEEQLVEELYDAFGPKWMAMATILQKRTDNDIKNKWNSMQRKKERQRREQVAIHAKSMEALADEPIKHTQGTIGGAEPTLASSDSSSNRAQSASES